MEKVHPQLKPTNKEQVADSDVGAMTVDDDEVVIR